MHSKSSGHTCLNNSLSLLLSKICLVPSILVGSPMQSSPPGKKMLLVGGRGGLSLARFPLHLSRRAISTYQVYSAVSHLLLLAPLELHCCHSSGFLGHRLLYCSHLSLFLLSRPSHSPFMPCSLLLQARRCLGTIPVTLLPPCSEGYCRFQKPQS